MPQGAPFCCPGHGRAVALPATRAPGLSRCPVTVLSQNPVTWRPRHRARGFLRRFNDPRRAAGIRLSQRPRQGRCCVVGAPNALLAWPCDSHRSWGNMEKSGSRPRPADLLQGLASRGGMDAGSVWERRTSGLGTADQRSLGLLSSGPRDRMRRRLPRDDKWRCDKEGPAIAVVPCRSGSCHRAAWARCKAHPGPGRAACNGRRGDSKASQVWTNK